METGIRHTHLLSVILFLLIYLIKTVLLLSNKNEGLAKFTKVVKVPEMIVSTLFLVTGIYLLTQIPEIKTLLIIKIVAVLISIPLAIIGFKKKNKVLA
ncbi:MAG: SirB2 family protein, partial [Bacteroidota bacterium]